VTKLANPKRIAYRCGYKYQLAEDYVTRTRIRPIADAGTRFIRLTQSGELTVRADYAWDGPSGPTADTASAMRASLEHDAKYQLMRLGLIAGSWKATADKEYRDTLKEDGALGIRARLHYWALDLFGREATRPSAEPRVFYAP